MSWPYFGYCERCNSKENKPHKPVNDFKNLEECKKILGDYIETIV